MVSEKSLGIDFPDEPLNAVEVESESIESVCRCLERVLLETDGPFAKVKGKILFPSDVVEVISYLSIQWGESKNAVQDQLKSNLKALLVCEKKV